MRCLLCPSITELCEEAAGRSERSAAHAFATGLQSLVCFCPLKVAALTEQKLEQLGRLMLRVKTVGRCAGCSALYGAWSNGLEAQASLEVPPTPCARNGGLHPQLLPQPQAGTDMQLWTRDPCIPPAASFPGICLLARPALSALRGFSRQVTRRGLQWFSSILFTC